MFDWMVWTTPVAVFFACIALTLVGMMDLAKELRLALQYPEGASV